MTVYDSIGGTAGCRRLAETLYDGIERDAVLGHFFPGKTRTCAIEEFSAFLVQFLGGPAEDSQRRRWLSLSESHRRFEIGKRERSAWLKKMKAALQAMPLDARERTALQNFFEHTSAALVNSGTAVAWRAHSCPPRRHLVCFTAQAHIGHPELQKRWASQQTVEHATEAIRSGDAETAIAAVSGIGVRDSVRCGLLAQMLHSGTPELRAYVHREIRRSPEIVRARYYSRTLLHTAAALGLAETVEVLLAAGADPNGPGHAPLYCLANEYRGAGGGPIVRTLVQAGARVDACDNVKKCTALHMAARRGSVQIAEALLECGADIDARDAARVTPLGRAINTRQKAVADFLRGRGARL